MENFFQNVVDAFAPRAIVFSASNQGCIIDETINPSVGDKTLCKTNRRPKASFTIIRSWEDHVHGGPSDRETLVAVD